MQKEEYLANAIDMQQFTDVLPSSGIMRGHIDHAWGAYG